MLTCGDVAGTLFYKLFLLRRSSSGAEKANDNDFRFSSSTKDHGMYISGALAFTRDVTP